MNPVEPWRVHRHVLTLIESDKYRAQRKYRKVVDVWWWWQRPDPDRAAFFSKTSKRFALLYTRGSSIPEDNREETNALFCAYKECLTTYSSEAVMLKERQCYNRNLAAYLKHTPPCSETKNA